MIMYVAADEMDLGLQLWGSSEINQMTNASLSGDKYAAPIKNKYFRKGGEGRTGFASRTTILLMVSLYLCDGLCVMGCVRCRNRGRWSVYLLFFWVRCLMAGGCLLGAEGQKKPSLLGSGGHFPCV